MTEIRWLIRPKIAPKEVKEVVVDYAVEDFDHDLVIDFSDYGAEANATAKLSLQNLEGTCKIFYKSSIRFITTYLCGVFFV